MAGRGKKLLENLQKVREQSEPKSSDVPQVGQPSGAVPPSGRGRGRIIQAMLSQPQREISPQRESSGSSSSDQPSPSGAIGSPPSEELEQMTIEEPPRRVFPTQPEPIRNKERGTDGNTIQLTLNYIKLNRQQNYGIFLYSIAFNPMVDSRALRGKILRQSDVVEVIGSVYQFTGMNLYLPQRHDTLSINTTTPVDGSAMKIEIQFLKEPPFEELIPFYNTTFRKIMKELKLVQIQRRYYDPTARIEVPQHKLEIWPGWCTSVLDLDDGLLLSCDASSRLLRTSTAKDALKDLFRQPNFKENAQKRLIGCIVLTRYNNRPYKVDDIDFNSNPLSTFDWNGTQVTYVDYFKKSWNLDIQDKRQPLLVNRPKPRRGETTEPPMVCLIPELCYMTGLTDDIRSDTRVMKDIASHTRIAPAVRQAKLQTFINNVLENPSARRHLTDWGLDLNARPYDTTGRTMTADKVILGNDMKVSVSAKADWSRDLTNNALFHTINVDKWLIVFTRRDSAKVDEFIKCLKLVTRSMGFTFGDPDKVESLDDSPMRYVEAIKTNAGPPFQLIVVMTPGSSQREDRYNAIKRLCYCEIGIPNQVVRAYTLSDAKMRSVCQKIAIQISCKVGGQPWALPIPFKSCMIVGVDVYHDPTQRGKSVVGFVSSVNQSVSHWYSRVFFQNSHEEIVNTMESGIVASVRKYYEVNKSLPQRIFLYRDGVSDGQLLHVLEYEVTQIQNSLLDFGKAYNDYKPQLSVIVVQKRINAKLLLKGRNPNELLNPPPGSVLDHSITRKNYYDFYLISQFVTQGTVTPTHYIVIHDTNEMKPDRMQKLSYKMTHLYYNWFGTIRVPAPCQYAHKAAAMVGQVLKKSPSENLADKLYFL